MATAHSWEAMSGADMIGRTLHIAAPSAEICRRAVAALEEAGIAFDEPHQGLLTISLRPGVLEQLSLALADWLSGDDLRSCRSVVLPDTTDATIADLARVDPLDTLFAPLQQQWLQDLIVEDRLTSYFQPIVEILDPTRIHGYECLLRGRERNGDIVCPTAMFDVARENGSLSQLDRIARTMAIRCSNRSQIAESIFINLNPCATTFSGHYLCELVEEVYEAGIPCERITFEIVETDRVDDLTGLQKAIEAFRKYSFKIALDDVGAGYNGLTLLTRIKPDLIKLDVDLVRDVDSDPYKAEISSKLLEAAQNLGVETIAEGIETEAEWKWFCERGADYGQGFAFARPGPTPPSSHVPVGARLYA